MLWGEKVRFCKDCKHFKTKDWSVVNNECKLGKKTPSGGSTYACDKYENDRFVKYYCKDCARWDDKLVWGKCIKDYPTPKGRNSEICIKFVKG